MFFTWRLSQNENFARFLGYRPKQDLFLQQRVNKYVTETTDCRYENGSRVASKLSSECLETIICELTIKLRSHFSGLVSTYVLFESNELVGIVFYCLVCCFKYLKVYKCNKYVFEYNLM